MNVRKIIDIVLLFILFFLANIVIAPSVLEAFYRGIPSAFSYLPSFHAFLYMSAPEFAKAVHLSDMDSYVSNALHFLHHHEFIPWMLNLWPPGESFTLFMVLSLVGIGHYPLTMLMFGAALWSVTFIFVYYSLYNCKNNLLRIIFAAMPLFFLIFYQFAFGMNLFLSEGPSLPIFIISACFLVKYLQHNKIKDLVIAAVLIALLAYFRGYFELFIMFLSVIFIIVFFKTKKTSLLVSLIIMHLVLLPWRLHNLYENHSLSWQHLESGTWIEFWDPNNIWVTGNIPCQIKPAWCDFLYKKDISQSKHIFSSYHHIFSSNFYRNNTLAIYLTHPIKWYEIKLKNFDVFWFNDFRSNDIISKQKNNWHLLFHTEFLSLIEGILILVAGLGSIILGCFFWKNVMTREAHLFSQFCLAFVVFNMGLFTFFHYETRYSLYLQLLFIYLPFWLFFGFEKK